VHSYDESFGKVLLFSLGILPIFYLLFILASCFELVKIYIPTESCIIIYGLWNNKHLE